jgi:hypothetical protein
MVCFETIQELGNRNVEIRYLDLFDFKLPPELIGNRKRKFEAKLWAILVILIRDQLQAANHASGRRKLQKLKLTYRFL